MKLENEEECRKVKENISALLDGELEEKEARTLIKRIEKCAEEGCRECLNLLENIKTLDCICKSQQADCNPPAEVLTDLKERLMRVLNEHHTH